MVDDTDIRLTSDRTAVQQLYMERGIQPKERIENFLCAHVNDCSTRSKRVGRQFSAGTWPYVGAEYRNALICGCPTRILFVAMERGGRFRFKDSKEELEFRQTQEAFRWAAEITSKANPHMRGVAMIMAYLVDERDPRKRASQFALTNAVKCVERTGSMASTSNKTMMKNCSDHLRTEIDLLKPELVITQGSHPRTTVLTLLDGIACIGEFRGERRNGCAVYQNSQFVLLTAPHPARQKGWRWKTGAVPDSLRQALELCKREIHARKSVATIQQGADQQAPS